MLMNPGDIKPAKGIWLLSDPTPIRESEGSRKRECLWTLDGVVHTSPTRVRSHSDCSPIFVPIRLRLRQPFPVRFAGRASEGSTPTMSSVNPEELIEVVRFYPVLYNQTMEQYRNAEYKDMVWKEVARKLNVEGQEEECKRRWNGIRDSLRRARQKRKTKSGQAATSSTKYKYEAILEFLIPHLSERKGLSNIQGDDDDGGTSEAGNEPQQQNEETQQPDVPDIIECEEIAEASELTQAATQDSRVSAEKKTTYARRKRKLVHTEVKSHESASSQLMSYILAEKEAEKMNKLNPPISVPQHPVDVFLAGIALSLKSLDPIRLLNAKAKIFNLVQQYELEQLGERELGSTTHASPFAGTSWTSTPSHISEDESNGDAREAAHIPHSSEPTTKSVTDITYFEL
ncbi:hypothetical protein GE061_014143 [Apolygus lucorum]|uniref:MADF domain-containing protein n=1 Tax=Apolygus lucorum TaxID=248454 RepID=A0A8S9XPR4_APOLU|nr:hypothetical protein GE061_014143 [Apolygus lucorum]